MCAREKGGGGGAGERVGGRREVDARERGGAGYAPSHDSGLVFQNGQRDLVRRDVARLVHEVHSALLRDVSQHVHAPAVASRATRRV